MSVKRAVFVGILGGAVMLAGCSKEAAPKPDLNAKLYTVEDGKVDAKTLEGWKIWRGACARCHGLNQEGAVGPPLLRSVGTLSRDDFKKWVVNGNPAKGMPNYDGDKQVMDNVDTLYAYLRGRSDGAIPPGKLAAIGN